MDLNQQHWFWRPKFYQLNYTFYTSFIILLTKPSHPAWWGNRTLVVGLKVHCTTTMLIRHWKWWDLNPQLLYAKQIFYQLNYIPFLKPIGFEPISIVSKTTALPIKLGFSLPRQLPLARPCYDLAPIVNQGFFTN